MDKPAAADAPVRRAAGLRPKRTPTGANGRAATAAALRQMALGDNQRAAQFRRPQPQRRQNTDAKYMLTVVVTASMSPLNPSTAILRELLLSLIHLQLPAGSPVLLSHDGPRPSRQARSINETAGWRAGLHYTGLEFPPKYLRYLANVDAMLPAASACTGLAMRLLLRSTNGMLAGNLAFAIAFVRTPFMLKVEHDHLFARPIDAIAVVRDMIADPRLKYVRFNRRENVRLRCDAGDYYRDNRADQVRGFQLWGAHEAAPGVVLRHNYTRTTCFSDMNHLTSTAYYRQFILPVITRGDLGYPVVTPENLVQDHLYICRNHSVYGTYLFGGLDAPPAIAHVDAALHGVGEVLPQVVAWLAHVKARSRNGTADGPFQCQSSLDLRPPRGMRVHESHWRRQRAPPSGSRAGGSRAGQRVAGVPLRAPPFGSKLIGQGSKLGAQRNAAAARAEQQPPSGHVAPRHTPSTRHVGLLGAE